jgi:hypothetical protein
VVPGALKGSWEGSVAAWGGPAATGVGSADGLHPHLHLPANHGPEANVVRRLGHIPQNRPGRPRFEPQPGCRGVGRGGLWPMVARHPVGSGVWPTRQSAIFSLA